MIAGIIIGEITKCEFKKSFIYINIGIFTAKVILLFFIPGNFIHGIYENFYPDHEPEIISQDMRSFIEYTLILFRNSSVVFIVFMVFLAIKKLLYKFKNERI